MYLPYSDKLTVSKLATSFGNTSATYKFYWLLALLELVAEGQTTKPTRHVFASLIDNALLYEPKKSQSSGLAFDKH